MGSIEALATLTGRLPCLVAPRSRGDVVVCEVEAARSILSGEKTITCLPVEPQPDRRAEWGRCGLDDVFRFGTAMGEVPEFRSRPARTGRPAGPCGSPSRGPRSRTCPASSTPLMGSPTCRRGDGGPGRGSRTRRCACRCPFGMSAYVGCRSSGNMSAANRGSTD